MSDDLTPFENDPIFQALTAAASPDELAGEGAALAAFRAANGAKPHRRFAARIGTSGGLAVAGIALFGGVAAAAYSNVLPDSVQHLAHVVAGPIGVPSPPKVHHHRHAATGGPTGSGSGPISGTTPPTGAATGAPGPAGTTSPSATPSTRPSAHAKSSSSPSASASPSTSPTPTPSGSTSPSSTPTPTPTPTDTGTPTPTPTATVGPPAAVAISVSQTRVPANTGVEITGSVTDAAGQPVVGHQVSAYAQLGGGATEWLAVASSGADGSVDFQTPGLSRNVTIVLRAGDGVHSAGVRVVVVPTLAAAVGQGGAQDGVSITAQGAQVGDGLSVYEHEQGGWVLVDSLVLDSSQSAAFDATPDPKKVVRYRAVLTPTHDHAGATVLFVTEPSGVKQ